MNKISYTFNCFTLLGLERCLCVEQVRILWNKCSFYMKLWLMPGAYSCFKRQTGKTMPNAWVSTVKAQ